VPAEFAGSSEAIAAPGSSGAHPSQPQKHPWLPPLPAPAQGELTETFLMCFVLLFATKNFNIFFIIIVKPPRPKKIFWQEILKQMK
jgi:hypothetical protein